MCSSKFLNVVAYFLIFSLVFSCSSDDHTPPEVDASFFSAYDSRSFEMGFTSWPYASTLEAVSSTNNFISDFGDIYSEHMDSEIPWSAWMNDTELPSAFLEKVAVRVARKASSQNKLTLSISLLNIDRTDLMPDYDGSIPDYNSLADAQIVSAYYKHVNYLVQQLSPDYLVIAVEVDGLLKQAPEKWEGYKSLMTEVKTLIKNEHPNLLISESLMLHEFFEPNYGNAEEITAEVSSYMNAMDFAAVSFYPFLKGIKTKQEMQMAFDYLHRIVNVPIAFAETGHLSEDLSVTGFDLFIAGNHSEQDAGSMGVSRGGGSVQLVVLV